MERENPTWRAIALPLEEFIITVFCWVETVFDDVTAGITLRARRFAPRLSDSEGITLKSVGEGLEQTGQHLDRVGEGSGHLVIFDRSDRPWAEKLYRRAETHQGRRITVWGC